MGDSGTEVSQSIAVLGAGIMGASTALHLARRGLAVTVFDQAPEPFLGASRWNEGKIHLGFLYAADPTLRTARAVLAGGLDFRRQVERLTGMSLRTATTSDDDNYLVHRDSVVSPEAAAAYFDRVAAMVASSPGASDYLVDVAACTVHALESAELQTLADPAVILAGYRVPERSVNTQLVADAFVHALRSQPGIELALGQLVTGVRRADSTREEWFVCTGAERHGPYAAVVNALWQGRPEIDASVGHRPDTDQQFRYRVSVFAQTGRKVDVPSAVLSVGPFGDVKNFGGRDFYLSWYPLGLLAVAEAAKPPPEPVLTDADRKRLAEGVFVALKSRMPWVSDIEQAVTEARVEGGWVYSQGNGLLDDPEASVHQRSRLGATNIGTYYSVDTGKYSVAPTLAEQLAETIVHDR